MLYVCIFHEYPIKKLCLVNKNLINASVDDAELAINRLFTVLKAAKQENYDLLDGMKRYLRIHQDDDKVLLDYLRK